MRHEGLLYVLAFCAILGVGAVLIVPRLRPQEPAQVASEHAPLPSTTRGEPLEPEPWPARTVRIRGERGALRGPLRPVVGGRAEWLSDPAALTPSVRIQPSGPWIELGAAGHLWTRVATRDLKEDAEIVLLEAASTIVIRVRDPDGRPAVNVPLRIRPGAPGPDPRTDEGGALILDHLPPGKVIVDANTSERAGPVLHLTAGVDRDVRLLLDPVWEIRARLQTATGRPAVGARVEAFGPAGAWGQAATSDAQGVFRWRGPVATQVALRVRAPGHAELCVEASPPLRGPLVTDLGALALGEGGVRIQGTVRAEHFEPGARVQVEPAVASVVRELFGVSYVLYEPDEVEISADGRFALDDLPAGISLRVAVRGAGAALDTFVRGTAEEQIQVDLSPPAGETLDGTLALPDGSAAGGVTLIVSEEPRDGDRVHTDDRVVSTDSAGAFVLRGIGVRVVYVRAYTPGCRSLLQRVVLPLAEPLSLRFEPAIMDAARRVTGVVTDESRVPLADVTIRVAGISVLSDAQGRFVLEGVESLAPEVPLSFGYEPGSAQEAAQAFERIETVNIRPGGAPLSLVLSRTARLRLRLTDGLTGEPLNWAHVMVRMSLGQRIFADRGWAARDGWVELSGLPPGLVEVSLLAPGLRVERIYTLVPGAVREEELGLSPAAWVQGEVLDSRGQAIAGAQVAVLGPSWQARSSEVVRDRDALLRSTTSDAQGHFELHGLRSDQHMDLVVWAPDYAPIHVRAETTEVDGRVRGWASVRLSSGVFLALELEEAGRKGSIRGALADLEAARGSDYLDLVHRGMLRSTVGSTQDWAMASEHLLFEERGYDGYLLGPLLSGPYDVSVECPGYQPLRRKVTLIDPEQSVLYDLGSGEDRRYGLRVTRFVFQLTRDP